LVLPTRTRLLERVALLQWLSLSLAGQKPTDADDGLSRGLRGRSSCLPDRQEVCPVVARDRPYGHHDECSVQGVHSLTRRGLAHKLAAVLTDEEGRTSRTPVPRVLSISSSGAAKSRLDESATHHFSCETSITGTPINRFGRGPGTTADRKASDSANFRLQRMLFSILA
jgi:hypothetical protein